ncbi:MAG: tRNA (adenosine(37)-N6)-threonylcarbamoyltransferase complex ATPase subunit type 1 TsaE [Coxiellaceae bacterium]|nr:tRNA (adenosine(37)-N6)-threonylcarbamoyltransferase complex ATPase subunit type 1 TsaE [Coxiellaceae bacterium]
MSAIWVDDENELMTKVAQPIAELLQPGMVVYLQGNLGAGKTTLCRQVLQCLGYDSHVKSPTYTLVETYNLPTIGEIHHFDLYRLNDPFELENMGIRDYMDSNAVCLVEWPEKGRGNIPEANVSIHIEIEGDRRVIHISQQLILKDERSEMD